MMKITCDWRDENGKGLIKKDSVTYEYQGSIVSDETIEIDLGSHETKAKHLCLIVTGSLKSQKKIVTKSSVLVLEEIQAGDSLEGLQYAADGGIKVGENITTQWSLVSKKEIVAEGDIRTAALWASAVRAGGAILADESIVVTGGVFAGKTIWARDGIRVHEGNLEAGGMIASGERIHVGGEIMTDADILAGTASRVEDAKRITCAKMSGRARVRYGILHETHISENHPKTCRIR